ncbi:EamA family transporter [Okibacterium fritillariae]|uniref:EamA family transporter n=1 Tax=Okibacterium fritillariae TaxID=123320 RepID=UPI0009A88674|nr:DMT family transporter [Okibacterium fritillariae]
MHCWHGDARPFRLNARSRGPVLAVCLVSRQRLPRGWSIWAHLFVVAMLLCVVPFLLFAWAQQHVPSSVASIINATTPLMTMAAALLALPSERSDR